MPGTPADPADADAEGSRRYLTLLFSDLSDSTHLGELMEAEHYAQMLASWRRLCRDIIPRHGGHIARIQGDGVLALFGYPEAQEDDGRRATEAALELHAAVRQLRVGGGDEAIGPLSLHSGIHAGLVFLSDGDVERGRFELLGNVPNLAARLASLAEADDICVSAETLGPQAYFFTTSERQWVTLKGRTPPLAVLRVLGHAPAKSRFEAMTQRGLCPFVGREPQLKLLREHLRRAIAGTPQCVALAGGPGLGKTRLVEELLRHAAAEQCRVLRGYCESYLSAEPLQPWRQMLRSLGSDAPVPTEPPADPGATALPALIDQLAAQRPLLLVIDDWQWADDASQQVLDAVLALKRPIFALIASRGAAPGTGRGALAVGLGRAPDATIELQPLDDDETARAVAHLLPGADPFVVAEIHRYAGGIPLYIEELCHSAAAQGPQGLAELRLDKAAWLDALIESRVARLPPEPAALVRAAAVIGNVLPLWLLQRITGQPCDTPRLQALAEQDFLFAGEQPGTLRFKHGITRDVVYQAVGLHQRQQMHRQIAQALAASDGAAAGEHPAAPPARLDAPPAQLDAPPAHREAPPEHHEALAYHHAAGGQHESAAHYAELAGDKAMAASALDRARAQYAAALQALDRLAPLAPEAQARWCAITQKLGMACVFDPLALADGVAVFERGLAMARATGRLDTIARAEYWLGYICYAKGTARTACAHCEAALDLANRIGDERLAAQVRATLGQALLSACDYERALPLFDAAMDSKRRQARPGSSIAVGSAYTLACKATLLGDRGQFAQADACFAEALHLVADSRHQVASSVRHWVSVVRQWQGRWEEAMRMAEESARIAEGVKSRQQLAMGRALAGYARWVLTRAPEGLQALREAAAWIEARKGGLATSLVHGWLVDGALATGAEAEARRHAARLFMRQREHDRIGEALGCRALARGAARLNDFARAEHYLRLARHSARVRGSAHEAASNQLCEAQIAFDRGLTHEVSGPLDAATRAFEAMDMRWHLERARRLREQL